MNALPKPAYVLSEPHLSGYRVVIGYETLADAQAAQGALSSRSSEPGGGAVLPSIALDGSHLPGEQRQWLARQLLDSRLDDSEAFSVVAFHPDIKEATTPHPGASSSVGANFLGHLVTPKSGVGAIFVPEGEPIPIMGDKGSVKPVFDGPQNVTGESSPQAGGGETLDRHIRNLRLAAGRDFAVGGYSDGLIVEQDMRGMLEAAADAFEAFVASPPASDQSAGEEK